MEKFTFVIAVFTVIYSVVTIGLYRIAKNTLTVSQRAFIYAERADIFNSPRVKTSVTRPPGTPTQIDIAFKNSGQTVASNEVVTINILANKLGIPSDFTYPVDNGSKPTLLAPQAEGHMSKTIGAQDLADAESGKTLLFVYGDISYDDVFGEKHRTEYCFQFYGYTTTPDGNLGNYIFYSGPTHNCADDGCKDGSS